MATPRTSPASTAPDSVGGDILKIILAVIFPPLGVLMEVGLTKHFWINLLLTFLGFLPGIIHALYIIVKK
ncbi:MAG: YqaE/Pmp3 family membrane protein [Pseudobdellovibrionaceae bacterium]